MKKSLFQRPVTHILGLGLLVGVALIIGKGPPTSGDEARRVVLTVNDLMQLRVGFLRTWQREPTQTELRGELEKFLREEVLYREALARGYDRDDLVVRRAMQRKMQFMAEVQSGREPPTDEEIRAYFALRQERYRTPAVVSFAQVYFSTEARGDRAERDAREALETMRQIDPDANQLSRWGDSLMLESFYSGETEDAVAAVFGKDFAAAMVDLEPGRWEGPILSGYGLHLVRITGKKESRIPELSEVRSRVVTDMEYEARNAAREQLFQEIAQQYHVIFDDEVKALMEGGSS